MAKKSFENVSDDIFSAGLTAPAKAKEVKAKKTKKDAYKIVITIDDDVNEYFNNIMWIKRNTKAGYINELIKADYIKTLGLGKNATDDEINARWQEYKKEMRL